MNAALRQFVSLVRRNPLMAASLTVFLLLGMANYLLWQRQTELNQRHDRVRQEGEAMLLALAGRNRIDTQLDTVRAALAHIDKNLAVETDLAENLNYFYQMEKASRVRLAQLNQLSSQPVGDDHLFKSIPFSFQVTGTYLQIMDFLHGLETGPRLLKIKTYGFTRADPQKDALGLNLTVEVLGRL